MIATLFTVITTAEAIEYFCTGAATVISIYKVIKNLNQKSK